MDRSLTPPLDSRNNENGTHQCMSLYDDVDSSEINKNVTTNILDNTSYLSPPANTETDAPKNESNTIVEGSKNLSTHQKISHEAHKSREKEIRKSHDRENNSNVDKRKGFVPAPKEDKRSRRSKSRDKHKTRKRSRSKSKQIKLFKTLPAENNKHRQKRWTITLPRIEYCENGRYSRIESNSGPIPKIPKLNEILNATENNDVRTDETELDKKSIIKSKQQKENDTVSIDKDYNSDSKCFVEAQKAGGNVDPDNIVDMSNWEADFSLSKIELSNVVTSNKESQLDCKNKADIINDQTDPSDNSNRDVLRLSVSNEITDVPKNVLPEKKIQKYYEEYDDFIQSLSSPHNRIHTQNTETAMLSSILDQPANIVNAKYLSTIEDSKESETSNTSTSSESSSSESSTSSTSDSSSESDSSSDDDSASESDKHKEKPQNNDRHTPSPMSTSHQLRFPMDTELSSLSITKTLETLDHLLDDDDSDIFSKVESFKNLVKQKQKAKEILEKSKSDVSDNSCVSGNTKQIETGISLNDSDRKKISLRLKSTTALKQPAKEVDDLKQPAKEVDDLEQQEQNQTGRDRESTKSSRDESRSLSSRKSRRSEERSSRRREERRSRRSQDRSKRSRDKRSRRSEERRSRQSVELKSHRSDEKRSKRSEEKRSKRSEERRLRRDDRYDRSPSNYHHDSYYSLYRNRSLSPLPRGPRTPPETPPPNSSEFDEYRRDFTQYNSQINSMYQRAPRFNSSYHNASVDGTAGDGKSSINLFPQMEGPYSHMPPNIPGFMNEYANMYMHPNRNTAMAPYQSHHRQLPVLNSPTVMNASINLNNDYFYGNNLNHVLPPPQITQNHHLGHSGPFSNLIEVSQYDMPSSNLETLTMQPDNHQTSSIAVQKGNVLEIVPYPELCETSTEMDSDKSNEKSIVDKQQGLQRPKQERINRKMERHQRRIAREKRKEFLITEINRLSHQLIVGEDGKMIKAGDLLKSITFDGINIKVLSSINENGNENDVENEEQAFFEPIIFNYDPNAIASKSILFENSLLSSPKNGDKNSRKTVLFADGIAPGEGTSSSESSSNENDVQPTKRKKLSSRVKSKKDIKSSPSSNDSTYFAFNKENLFDTKFDVKDSRTPEEEIVPLPPPGSPPPNLPQPTLKNPDKYIVNQLIYFHYNIHTHEMYVSPFPYPTHDTGAPPPAALHNHVKSSKSNRVPNSKPTQNKGDVNLIVLSNNF